MGCPPGFHEGRVSSLLGGLTTAPSEVSCLRDSTTPAFGIANLLEPIANVVLPVLHIPGLIEPAATTYVEQAKEAANVTPEQSQYIDIGVSVAQTFLSSGASSEGLMGFFDDFGLDAVVDWASDIFDDVSLGEVAGFGLDVAQNFLPQPAANPYAIQVANRPVQPVSAGSVPGAVIRGAGAMARTGAVVGRAFFNKWPNLATGIQKMRNAGQNVSRSKLYSMLKRFGPEFLVSAGILTAAAVSELALAGPGHRRMNPANSKALRRATRRIKSFHRLCGDADIIKTRRRSCAKKC